MKKYGYIYKTTNLISKKQYIGQHISDTLDPSYLGSGVALTLAVQKYGKEKFQVEVLQWCEDQKDLNYWERALIELYGAAENNMFYNLNGGGLYGGKPNSITRKLMGKRSRQYWKDPKYRQIFVKLRKQAWTDPKYCQAQSEKAKQQWESPEYRKFIRTKNQAYWDNGGKDHLRQIKLRYWKDPKNHQRMAEFMRNGVKQCPFCNKFANPGNFKQFHGENCKEKQGVIK